MSFFNKLKQGLGISTAKAELQIPATIAKDSTGVNGKVVITAQSDQRVKGIKLLFVERYTSGRGDNQETKEIELGKLTLNNSFDIKKDERHEVDFDLPFQLKLSNNQSLAEEKGALGALGKVAMFAQGEKSEYEVKVSVDLEGVAFDPNDIQSIKLI